MPINIFELSTRGDGDYPSLTDIEKALYHIFNFTTIYEMEGFTHYFTTYRLRYVPMIISFLEAAKDFESAKYIRNVLNLIPKEISFEDEYAVEDYFCTNIYTSESLDKTIDGWGNGYYKLEEKRWQLINTYLKSIGHDTVL
jgi:hypothetical protein